MPARHSFDAELAALRRLREAAPEAARPQLARALKGRNNYLAAKAAELVLHHQLADLEPELAAAFGRFLENAAKVDPQCWAKNALAKALAGFGYQEPELFLAGMGHVQMEPVWGGSADTAGPLRGTCALALVQCRALSSHQALLHLTPLFADKEVAVQANAARAVEQVGTDTAALLLRLRAELGSGEPELLGACYSGVLALEGSAAVPWAARFLAPEDDLAAEAALALAQSRLPEAWEVLRACYARARDARFRGVVLTAIALLRQEAAVAWLLEMAAGEGRHAGEAQRALCESGPSGAVLERLRGLGRGCG